MTALTKAHDQDLDPAIIESLVIDGDLSRMRPQQRVAYYLHRCKSIGVDPGEQPFELLKLSGKLKLYATKACSNALTRVHQLSVEIKSTRFEGPMIIIEARASVPGGRFTDEIGVIDMDEEIKEAKQRGKTPITKANAIMKCATKAKRRAVLSLVGLGVLDETEVESIRGAQRVAIDVATGELDEPEAIETTAVEADTRPRISAEQTEIIVGLIEQLAELTGWTKREVWTYATRRAELSTTIRLSVLFADDAEHLRAALVAKIAEIAFNGHSEADSEQGDEQ